jgi:hypothetical protein
MTSNTIQIKKNHDDLILGVALLFVGLSFILGIRLITWIPGIKDALPICLFKHFTGIPCPGCGMTRSVIFLSQFKFWEAFKMNPLICFFGAGVFIYSMHCLGKAFFGHRTPEIVSTILNSRWIKNVIILMILINWFYLIIAGR